MRSLVNLTQFGAKLPLTSATRAYERILEILKSRRNAAERKDSTGPLVALSNTRLLTLPEQNRTFAAEVHALSPYLKTVI